MPQAIRFGVSIDENLLNQFDEYVEKKNYQNRSEALRDLIRDALVQEQWDQNKEIAGGISMVYDHHHNMAVQKLMDIQHDYHDLVLASQHIHMDHDNCLEIIVVRGIAWRVKELYERLGATKGIKHISMIKSTVGGDFK